MNRKHTLPKRLNSNKEANKNSGTEVLNKCDEECSRKDWNRSYTLEERIAISKIEI